MYVICFYWEGDRWQSNPDYQMGSDDTSFARHLKKIGLVDRKMSSRYVNNLFAGVTQFADREFDFICFTNEELDLDPGIEVRKFPLVSSRGVLPRLYMFSEESGLFGHQVLCLDLDVVVVGNMKALMSYDGLFCARSKFKLGERHKLDGDIMSFRAGPEATALFWAPFIADVEQSEEITHGRERYWIRHVADDIADRWDEKAPRAVLSYKWHMKRSPAIPKDASIVSFHGYPRPHQVNKPWLNNLWK